MRQVMPHRNNIVADRRRCKTFLHPMGIRPLNSGTVAIRFDPGARVQTPNNAVITIC